MKLVLNPKPSESIVAESSLLFLKGIIIVVAAYMFLTWAVLPALLLIWLNVDFLNIHSFTDFWMRAFVFSFFTYVSARAVALVVFHAFRLSFKRFAKRMNASLEE